MTKYTSKPRQREISDHMCECGCGCFTYIAPQDDERHGTVKGQPYRYLKGHVTKRPLLERFWENVIVVQDLFSCWLWIGGKDTYGYGHIGDGDKLLLAHRLSWEIHNGPIPKNMCVLHNCVNGDRGDCVRPSHLWLGTREDNNRDRDHKGRGGAAIGENNSHAKLVEADILEIRALRAAGFTYAAIGRIKNITDVMASLIVRRKNWSHIP